MKQIRILITCIGGELVPHLIENIKKSSEYNIFVIGVDSEDPGNSKYCVDKFAVVPDGNDRKYIKTMLTLSEKYAVDLIFPGSDEEAISLSKNKHEFLKIGVTIACNDQKILSILNNKVKTYKKLKKIGIQTPEFYYSSSKKEIGDQIKFLLEKRGSLVLKPSQGRGSRGVVVIDQIFTKNSFYHGSKELHISPDNFFQDYFTSFNVKEQYIVMERLIEPVFDLDILAWDNKPINMVTRRRLNPAKPNNGHIIETNTKMLEIGIKVVENFKLNWIFDIDFMMSQNGTPRVLEINSRASGSLCVSISAGIPIFENMLRLLNNHKVKRNDFLDQMIVYPYTALGVKIDNKTKIKYS